jgi:hypothetical protein
MTTPIKTQDVDQSTIYIDTGAGAGTLGDPFKPALATGAATAAKQDLLLTELQLKADLTETQPVSLSGAKFDTYSTVTLATDTALKTSTVMHGLTTAGSGAYIDVKVSPSGALTVDATISATAVVPTLSNVGDSASSVTVLASNSSRKGAVVVNDSSAVLYLKFGATASATSFTFKMQPDDTVIINAKNLYTGIIDGIWASDAGGSARVTEFV